MKTKNLLLYWKPIKQLIRKPSSFIWMIVFNQNIKKREKSHTTANNLTSANSYGKYSIVSHTHTNNMRDLFFVIKHAFLCQRRKRTKVQGTMECDAAHCDCDTNFILWFFFLLAVYFRMTMGTSGWCWHIEGHSKIRKERAR